MKSKPLPIIDNSLLTPATLINLKPKWKQPYNKEEPSVFYYTFESIPLPEIEGLSEPMNADDRNFIRNVFNEAPRYANVQLIEKDDFSELPQNARKFSVSISPGMSEPETYETFLKGVIEGKSSDNNNIDGHGVSFSFSSDSNGSLQFMKPGKPGIVDVKAIMFPQKLLKNTNPGYAKKVVLHELLHVFGFRHPCEAIANNMAQEGKVKKSENAVESCNEALHQHSIMVHTPGKAVTDCFTNAVRDGKSRINLADPKSAEIVKQAFNKCKYNQERSPLKSADRAALESLFGAVREMPHLSMGNVREDIVTAQIIKPEVTTIQDTTKNETVFNNLNPLVIAIPVGIATAYLAKKAGMDKKTTLLTAAVTGALLVATGASDTVSVIAAVSIACACILYMERDSSTTKQKKHVSHIDRCIASKQVAGIGGRG